MAKCKMENNNDEVFQQMRATRRVAFSNTNSTRRKKEYVNEPSDLARRRVSFSNGGVAKMREYAVKPTEQDDLVGLRVSYPNWPGTNRYNEIIDESKPVYQTASSRSARQKVAQQILDKMMAEGRRFLKLDHEVGKFYILSSQNITKFKIAQTLKNCSLVVEARAVRRARIAAAVRKATAMEAELEVDSATRFSDCTDDSSWFPGGGVDAEGEGSFLTFEPFPPMPMMFPYDVPSGISDHGW